MKILQRIVYFLVVGTAVFLIPAWFVLILGIIGGFLFPFYLEIILAGIAIDIVYGDGFSFPLWYSLIAGALFIVVEFAKTQIRYYDRS